MVSINSGERMFGAGAPVALGLAEATEVSRPFPSSAKAAAAGSRLTTAAANSEIPFLKHCCITLLSFENPHAEMTCRLLVLWNYSRETLAERVGPGCLAEPRPSGLSDRARVLAAREHRVNSGHQFGRQVQCPPLR